MKMPEISIYSKETKKYLNAREISELIKGVLLDIEYEVEIV